MELPEAIEIAKEQSIYLKTVTPVTIESLKFNQRVAKALDLLISECEHAERKVMPSLPSEGKEILGLIGKLDDFCLSQFKKMTGKYVDCARNVSMGADVDKEEFCETLMYHIKRDLQQYIKQMESNSLAQTPEGKEK